jgi:hypothetical protein
VTSSSRAVWCSSGPRDYVSAWYRGGIGLFASGAVSFISAFTSFHPFKQEGRHPLAFNSVALTARGKKDLGHRCSQLAGGR